MLGRAQQQTSLAPGPTAAGGAFPTLTNKLLQKKKPGKTKNPGLAALGAATPKAAGIFGF